MRCPECNKYLGYRLAYNERKKDEAGYFYRCPSTKCSMIAGPEGGYFITYGKLNTIRKNWLKIKEAFKNKSIARWLS